MRSASRRRFLCSGAAAAAAGTFGLPARGQTTALDAARLITGFPPGGTSDTFCRRVAEALRGSYARNTYVENRTGAAGQIAVQALKGAPADGSFMVQTPASCMVIYPHIYRKLQYNPFEDAVPVSLGCVFEFGFAVGPAVPAAVKTMPQFLEWCRANPALANFGSPAAGSIPHFIGVLLGKAGDVDLKHIPYRGSQLAIVDLIGGQISGVSAPIGEFTQNVQAGKIRLLSASGEKRSRFAPSTPTLLEQGFKDMAFDEWFGLFAPRGTPDAAVQRLNDALRKALADPGVVDGLGLMGLDARWSTPASLARAMTQDFERWGPIVKTIGFSADA